MQWIDDFQVRVGAPVMPVLETYWPLLLVLGFLAAFGLVFGTRDSGVGVNWDMPGSDGDGDGGGGD